MRAVDLLPHLDALEDTRKKAGKMLPNDEAVYLLCKGAILRGLHKDTEATKAFEVRCSAQPVLSLTPWWTGSDRSGERRRRGSMGDSQRAAGAR